MVFVPSGPCTFHPVDLALITIWADGNIQAQLEGTRRNKAVFLKIGEKMRSEGFHRTGDQCRLKIKGLRQEYKKITDNNKTSGRGRKTCKFYDRLNDILGHRPASVPHHLVTIGASIRSPSPGPST
uniref:Myb/SANT-like DNA-binding domain-containing protein n=1 Tax=Hippocampus comes TaxID=109280 RepID=A0A3Q3D1Y8_HIPCM